MLTPAPGTALHAWSWHQDASGDRLPPALAGGELQNSIRPMIAVARFVAFATKRLHDEPQWRERIAAETSERGSPIEGPLATAFAQEIRRTSPFVPVLPGWATEDIELDGQRVERGGRDDYEALTSFSPHGGADVATGHRCPGEKLAIAGLAMAVATLSDPALRILDAGLGVDLRRLPTKPASGGRIRASRCPFG